MPIRASSLKWMRDHIKELVASDDSQKETADLALQRSKSLESGPVAYDARLWSDTDALLHTRVWTDSGKVVTIGASPAHSRAQSPAVTTLLVQQEPPSPGHTTSAFAAAAASPFGSALAADQASYSPHVPNTPTGSRANSYAVPGVIDFSPETSAHGQGLSSPAAVFQLTHKLETALGVSADGTAAVPATTQDAQPAQAAADAAAPTLPTIQESVSARFSALRLPSGVVLTSV